MVVYPTIQQRPLKNLTRKMLSAAKIISIKLLRHDPAGVIEVYAKYLKAKYGIYQEQLKYDLEPAIKRIKNATFIRNRPDIFGETDGESIWISKSYKFTFNSLVSTIIHEALHCTVKVYRPTRQCDWKFLSEDDDHYCMWLLGEDRAWEQVSNRDKCSIKLRFKRADKQSIRKYKNIYYLKNINK